jgi:hypothetical protein
MVLLESTWILYMPPRILLSPDPFFETMGGGSSASCGRSGTEIELNVASSRTLV